MSFSLLTALPEIFLVLTLIAVLASELTYFGEKTRLISLISGLGILAALFQVLVYHPPLPAFILDETMVVDGLSIISKICALVVAFLSIGLSYFSKEVKNHQRSEYLLFILTSTLGLFFLSSSANLIYLCLSVFLILLSNSFLAGFAVHKQLSLESSIKFQISQAFGFFLLLLVCAILFRLSHTMNLKETAQALLKIPADSKEGLFLMGILFFSVMIFLGAFPMTYWLPDVLEGAPTPAFAFLVSSQQLIGVILMLRFFCVVFEPMLKQNLFLVVYRNELLTLSSFVTLIWSALLSIRQTQVKRLVAFLVLFQIGFLLMGFVLLTREAIASSLFLLIVQIFSLFGVTACISFFKDRVKVQTIDELFLAARNFIFEALAFVVFISCLVGIPPFPGFISEFFLISTIYHERGFLLVISALLGLVLIWFSFGKAVFGLFKPQKIMQEARGEMTKRFNFFLLGLMVPLLLFTIFANSIVLWISRSLETIFW